MLLRKIGKNSVLRKILAIATALVVGIVMLTGCVTLTYGGSGGSSGGGVPVPGEVGGGGGTGGAGGGNSGGGKLQLKVGISMSDKTLQRWKIDGENMEKDFKDSGYEVELKYAENKVDTQINQIKTMVAGGIDVLVIAPIDAGTLATTLDEAKQEGVKLVISYDRLITGTENVDYYVTFDNARVGELQGEYIRDMLDPENNGPFNIELFTGPTSDNNVNFFFTLGAMKVLQPYIDSGKLIVPSGQVTKEQCATQDWDTAKALERMENIISAQSYGPNGTRLDAVLSSNDSVAQGISKALEDAGYTADNFPILTGQDAEVANVKLINEGKMSMTVFKDVRDSAKRVVTMVDEFANGKEVEVNDVVDYDNGKKVVPAYQCAPVVVKKDNAAEVLVDSGYYTAEQVG